MPARLKALQVRRTSIDDHRSSDGGGGDSDSGVRFLCELLMSSVQQQDPGRMKNPGGGGGVREQQHPGQEFDSWRHQTHQVYHVGVWTACGPVLRSREPEPLESPLLGRFWSRSQFFCWLEPGAGAALFKVAPAASFWQVKKKSLVLVSNMTYGPKQTC